MHTYLWYTMLFNFIFPIDKFLNFFILSLAFISLVYDKVSAIVIIWLSQRLMQKLAYKNAFKRNIHIYQPFPNKKYRITLSSSIFKVGWVNLEVLYIFEKLVMSAFYWCNPNNTSFPKSVLRLKWDKGFMTDFRCCLSILPVGFVKLNTMP